MSRQQYNGTAGGFAPAGRWSGDGSTLQPDRVLSGGTQDPRPPRNPRPPPALPEDFYRQETETATARYVVFRPRYNAAARCWMFWDASVSQEFYYDRRAHQQVYPDGRRISATLPVSYYLNPHPQTQQASGRSSPLSDGPRSSRNISAIYSFDQLSSSASSASTGPTSIGASTRGSETLTGRPGGLILFEPDPQQDEIDAKIDSWLRDNMAAQRLDFSFDDAKLEALFPEFRVQSPAQRFFVVGRAFAILWREPGEFDSVDPYMVRRFVVIRAGVGGFCTAIPILRYGRQGVGKQGVVKSEHAIIHTTSVAPEPLSSEMPRVGETGLQRRAIRVVPDSQTVGLDQASRLNFAGVCTVQHNLKVKPVGMVHEGSMNALISQFRNVWAQTEREGDSSSSPDDDDSADDDEPDERSKGRNQGATANTRSKGKAPARDSRSPKQSSEPRGSAKSSAAQQARRQPVRTQPPGDMRAAMWARDGVVQLVRNGMTRDRAAKHLASRLQSATPGQSMEQATQEIQRLLAHSNTIVASQQRQPAEREGSSRTQRRAVESSGESSGEEDSE